MLVACVLVNRATWEVAEQVLWELRTQWPTPLDMSQAHRGTLRGCLRRLGFQSVRARRLKLLAYYYWVLPPKTAEDVMELPGCGKYAADSWALFVEGRRDVRPLDGKLTWYLQQQRRVG